MKALGPLLLILSCGLAQAQGEAQVAAEPVTAEREVSPARVAAEAPAPAGWVFSSPPAAALKAAYEGAAAAIAATQHESLVPVAEAEPDPAAGPLLETGVASWYGKPFHGRKTASGERFDMGALTAAHPKLPFGSWVRVRDPDSGRSVVVRINDRGPHIKRRIIDLSRAAAEALGVLGSGTLRVTLTLLSEAERLSHMGRGGPGNGSGGVASLAAP